MSKKLLFNLNKGEIQNYTYVKYNGNIVTATNTLNKPIKNAILKGDTKYRDVDTGEILDSFDGTKNLELVSVKMPVLQTLGSNIFGGETERGYIDPSTGQNSNAWNDLRSVDYIEVIGGNMIRILVTHENFSSPKIYEYDENKNFIGKVENHTLSPHAKFVRFSIGGNTDVGGVSQVMLYYGDIVKREYEPYKTSVLSTPEDLELRGIGDTQDTLDCLTGEVTQRIGEVFLDGSENWKIKWNDWNGCKHFFLGKFPDIVHGSVMLSNRFNPVDGTPEYKNVAFSIGKSDDWGGHTIVVTMPIDLLDTPDVDGFKKWLTINPVKAYYIKNEIITKTVDISIVDQNGNSLEKMNSFNDTTHVITSSETVPPIFEGYIATKESVE